MRLLIVRHADPDYSVDSLTEIGKIEAQLLAGRLSRLNVRAFYCSPLGRARNTAAPTLAAMHRDAEICPWLREFAPKVVRPDGCGTIAWDWLPQDWTTRDTFYDPVHWADEPEFRAAGVAEEYAWVTGELDALLARHGYRRDGRLYRAERANADTVVLFCHFGVECVLLSRLLHISPMPLWHGTCAAPASITAVYTEERREGLASFRVAAFGDTAHLYAAGREPSFSARFCETYANAAQRHD